MNSGAKKPGIVVLDGIQKKSKNPCPVWIKSIYFAVQSKTKPPHMNDPKQQLEALTEMRDLMNRSSRFLSLSGLSGVFAGIFALLGAAFAWFFFTTDAFQHFPLESSDIVFSDPSFESRISETDFYIFFFSDAGAVLALSLFTGWFLSRRKAKKAGIPFWDGTASRALINLMIPLVAGGFFCLVMLYHGLVGLIAPATLIFYGLALLNASKYTLNDIRYLGLCEILLGLLGTLFIGYGLVFWTLGFGLLHIVYGLVMYNKYDR